jgi:hypothetical protein
VTESLTIAGVNTSTFAVKVVDLSGLLSVPERRGDDIPIAGRHGVLRIPRKKYGQRTMPLEFLIRGAQPDGTIPTDPKAQFYENLHTLAGIIAQDVVELVHTLPDGTTRRIQAEVAAAIDPSRYKQGSLGRVSVAFRSAAAFWEAETTTTIGPFYLATGETRQLTELAGADAPIDDAVLEFGPCSNPTLTDTGSGVFLAYDDVIATGRSLILDTGAWTGAGTSGLVYDRAKLRTDPRDAGWFTLDPAPGGPTVQLDHTGGGTAPVTVTARKKWLFG